MNVTIDLDEDDVHALNTYITRNGGTIEEAIHDLMWDALSELDGWNIDLSKK